MTANLIHKGNPLNIRYNKENRWLGFSRSERGFCCFKDVSWGLRAATLILRSYRKRGIVTVEDIISTWAPSSDNNPTVSYINYVCNRAGWFPFRVIDSPFDVAILFYHMWQFEQGHKPDWSLEEIFNVVRKYYR